ncbi:MAG TPA: cytochrome c family protein [Candidatus Deferrimicrobium sp.]|nr:cytochrome c family protein [Candidatus Deferrimicrobium sp.]
MRRLTGFCIILALGVLFLASGLWASTEAAKPEYVGADKCKVCHKDQHESWAATKHAKAFSVLSAEEKKKPECISCHMTGKLADGTALEGIQCEACHGPGSEYKNIKIMNKKKWEADPAGQKKLAIEAGLIVPTEKECTRCHKKEGNPNFKPFDFAKRKGEVHPKLAAKPAETTGTK